MGQSEQLSMVGPDSGQKRKGYFISKAFLLVAVVVVILLIIITAVIAAHVAKTNALEDAKSSTDASTGSEQTTPAPLPTSEPEPEPTKAGPEPYWNIRLPRNVLPLDYDVTLDVDMKKLSFSGKTTININVTDSSSKYILVHTANTESIKATMKDKTGKDYPIAKQFEFKKNQFYVMEFDAPVKAGLYSLHFEHDSMLATDLKGFYKSSYTRGGTENFVAATQFQPTDCRRAFPSFDEPALKSVFTITLIHDPKYLALTNMPLKSTETKDGKKVDHFDQTIKMPTYLLAFVIGEFGENPNTVGNVSMSFYAPKDQVNQLDLSVEAGTKILPYFETFFKTHYPLPKSDMIAIPDFSAGAMENWGLILYRETALLYKDGESSEKNAQRIVIVVSHELAHQWFGNYVTMEWWSDLWLNEGFASYVEYFGVDEVKPSWKINDQFVIMDQHRAFSLDALVNSHPVYVEVKSPDQINEIFDAISYSKGCAILRMLGDFMGLETFKTGLKGYLNKYALSNAKTSDLWDSLNMVSGGQYNITAIMDSWTLQMGFPVVTVKRTATGFTLSQQHFLAEQDADMSKAKYNSSYGYRWYIPFKYESFTNDLKSEGIKTVWMNLTKEITVTGSYNDKIIKGNAGQNGFFRVNYEESEWKKISEALKKNFTQFSVIDRAGLIGDVFALAGAGHVPYETALNVFDYIDQETEYVPWGKANGEIAALRTRLGQRGTTYKHFKAYMLKKISKEYAKVDFNKKETDHLTIYKRSILVGAACQYGVESCLGNASKMFSDWKDRGISVDPNFRSLVYYYGISNGGVEEWDFAFKKSQETNVASEKINLLYGLSATQEPWIVMSSNIPCFLIASYKGRTLGTLVQHFNPNKYQHKKVLYESRYLQYSLNESYVKTQDASRVFSYITGAGPVGSSMGWSFFKTNWPMIKQRFGGGFFSMRSFILAATSSFSTEYELHEFDRFFNTIDDLGTATRAVTQAREYIVSKMKWLAKYEANVSTWLANHHA